jgi:ribonuclease H2 subunit C
MLAIQPSNNGSTKKVIPNILPCAIKHNGPVNASPRYWDPQEDDSENKASTVYFRGRKLRGRRVDVPEGYTGVVLQKTDTLSTSTKGNGAAMADRLRRMEEGEDEDEDMVMDEPVEVKVLEQKGRFDEIRVWGHDAVPEADDVFVKGVQEWIGFAEAVSLNPVEKEASYD